tara:strand:+ start:217 stop:393 length:177 start_codon:yes stop_codon:yes gene_type:complete
MKNSKELKEIVKDISVVQKLAKGLRTRGYNIPMKDINIQKARADKALKKAESREGSHA